jgi:hypothetical protein
MTVRGHGYTAGPSPGATGPVPGPKPAYRGTGTSGKRAEFSAELDVIWGDEDGQLDGRDNYRSRFRHAGEN